MGCGAVSARNRSSAWLATGNASVVVKGCSNVPSTWIFRICWLASLNTPAMIGIVAAAYGRVQLETDRIGLPVERQLAVARQAHGVAAQVDLLQQHVLSIDLKAMSLSVKAVVSGTLARMIFSSETMTGSS